jgi:hypothetical protein
VITQRAVIKSPFTVSFEPTTHTDVGVMSMDRTALADQRHSSGVAAESTPLTRNEHGKRSVAPAGMGLLVSASKATCSSEPVSVNAADATDGTNGTTGFAIKTPATACVTSYKAFDVVAETE